MKFQSPLENSRELSVKKVPLTDPEYKNFQIENAADERAPIFGAGLLLRQERKAKLFAMLVKETKMDGNEKHANALRSILKIESLRENKNLRDIKEELLKDVFTESPDEKQKTRQIAFWGPVFSNGSMVHKLEKIMKTRLETVLSAEEKMLRAIFGEPKFVEYGNYTETAEKCSVFFAQNPKKMKPDLLKDIITTRAEGIKMFESFLKEDKERLIGSFLKKINLLIEKNQLSISYEKIQERMKSFTLHAGDPFLHILKKTRGHYEGLSDTIEISPIYKLEEIERTIDHEILHAIAGGIALQLNSFTIDDDGDKDRFSPTKSGLLFYSGRNSTIPKGRILSWMDEGITEHINMDMNNSKNGSYFFERKIIDYLIKNSQGTISKKDFYDAYFEEYSSEYGKQGSHWRILVGKFKEIYGPSVIREINDWVRKEGPEKALEKLESQRRVTI